MPCVFLSNDLKVTLRFINGKEMKTKIYFSGKIVKTIILTILLLLTIFMFAVAIFALVNKEWWIVFMGMLLGLFFSVFAFPLFRPIIVFKGNRMILYGNKGDYRQKIEIYCSNVKNPEIYKNRDKDEHIHGYQIHGGEIRKITLYAKMKKQSPLHISLDGFTKKQRQKIVAEIEKRRDYYAPIIEKERQEKIKAKLQEQKNREKQ